MPKTRIFFFFPYKEIKCDNKSSKYFFFGSDKHFKEVHGHLKKSSPQVIHTLTFPRCSCACSYSGGTGALFGPEFASAVGGVFVHASPTRIHACHTGWDQGTIQDTGEHPKKRKNIFD